MKTRSYYVGMNGRLFLSKIAALKYLIRHAEAALARAKKDFEKLKGGK